MSYHPHTKGQIHTCGESKRGFASLSNSSPSFAKGGGYRGRIYKSTGGEVINPLLDTPTSGRLLTKPG